MANEEVKSLTEVIRTDLKGLILRARKLADGLKTTVSGGLADLDEVERAHNDLKGALGELRGVLGGVTNGPPQ
jgi:hypothetical protein